VWGDNKGEQKSDTFKNTESERGRKEKNKGKNERKSRDKSKADRSDNNNNNRQRYENGRSKSRSRIKHVETWPAGKKYLGPTGRLSTEIEKWFSQYCYKCGLGNHRSFECLIYPSKTEVMTLCNICRSGFHTHCKTGVMWIRIRIRIIKVSQGIRFKPPTIYSLHITPHLHYSIRGC
jgi:hypothetical protein